MMAEPIRTMPCVRREPELDPADRRLIDRLAEYGVLPTGKSPLVPPAQSRPIPSRICSADICSTD
jgi:hypothetical protein